MRNGYFYFAAAVMLFAPSCSEKQAATDDLPIAIHPILTRATETNFEEGDEIGLTITLSGNSTYERNALLVHNGEYFESSEIKWYSTDKDGLFEAYFPFVESYNGDVKVRENQDDGGYYDSDILIAVAENVQPNVRGVSLSFLHGMSRIGIRVINASSYDIAEVRIGKTQGNAVIDYENRSIKAKMTSPVIEITAQPLGDDIFRAIIVPQEAGIEITVKNSLGYEISKSLPKMTFASGKSYNTTITVSDDFDITDVEIQSDGEISGWEDGGTIPE